MKYKYVFVVLVYKNLDVLDGFYNSIMNLESYKVIIVDSFYNDETNQACKRIAEEKNSDFVSVPNNGYGAGNNIGVQYAMDNYEFDFLIISNSDIIVRNLIPLNKYIGCDCIIAPEVIMLTGKKQNPSLVGIPGFEPIYYYLSKQGFLFDKRFCLTLSHILSRLGKIFVYGYCLITCKHKVQIFGAHGSFIVFTSSAIRKLHPLFDDDMFLYNEETYLAYKAKKNKVPVYYCNDIVVNHLEGASGSGDFNKQLPYYKKSFEILDNKRNSGLI